ncbi:Ycf66 family protein [Chamaesiphon minutus]|uniref:Cell division protein n=1 Tax=Chamaesiphon minutus (strain ATCC 27169 / PCC 6605) TaxID=1173020 RepID=K9UJW1_CHAP6|nr:Ycf66 family protein [Chamaesiphon minutus]AFY95110.1 cell division protein [Chamaesiphon minutus PCC 6605]
MLAYILAVLVGTGSVGLYAAAFLLPEIHRKNDFIWSGVGLFYALFLWLYAHQVTGGILVGQTSSVVLMGWFAWQIVKMRRQLVAVERQASITSTAKTAEPEANRSSVPKAAKPPAKTATSTKSTPPSVPPAKSPGASVAANTTAPATIPSRQSKPPAPNQIPLSEVKIPPARQPVVTEATKVPPQSVVSPPQPPAKQSVATPPSNLSTSTSQNPAAKPDSGSNIQPTTPTAPKSEPVVNTQPTTLAAKPDSGSNIQPTTPTVTKSEPAANLQSTTPEQPEDEAWIQLELKPSSPKPLGGAVKPPTPAPSTPEPLPSSPLIPETVAKNTPTDATQTTVKVEDRKPDRD